MSWDSLQAHLASRSTVCHNHLACDIPCVDVWPSVFARPPSLHNREDESTVRSCFRTSTFARVTRVEVSLGHLDIPMLSTKGGER